MRALRVVYIILSVLFFLLNVIAYIGLIGSGSLTNFLSPAEFVGYNFFFFISGLFALLAWKVGRRLERKKVEALLGTLAQETPKAHEKEIN